MMDIETKRVPKGHRWFAATYDILTRWSERKLLSQLRAGTAAEATGTVLEVGAGTGANLPYYKRDRVGKIVATEPDPYMLRRAERRARELGVSVEFHRCSAEALPFGEASFDTVVATLVFCSVDDPARALAEVKRVLKPGGAFRFIEHVRAEGGSGGRLQDILTPVWKRIGAGCHLNRRTAASIEAAGFEIVGLEHRQTPLMPIIFGWARPRKA